MFIQSKPLCAQKQHAMCGQAGTASQSLAIQGLGFLKSLAEVLNFCG